MVPDIVGGTYDNKNENVKSIKIKVFAHNFLR